MCGNGRRNSVRTVGTGSGTNATGDFDILNVEVTVNGAKRLFRGYRFCAVTDHSYGLKIARGVNGLWSKGGLQYAPPIR